MLRETQIIFEALLFIFVVFAWGNCKNWYMKNYACLFVFQC